jgi:hypothetical protein
MNLLMSRQDGREQVSTASASGTGPVRYVVVVPCMQRIDLSRGTETLHLQAARIAGGGGGWVVERPGKQGCDRCHLQTLNRGKQRGLSGREGGGFPDMQPCKLYLDMLDNEGTNWCGSREQHRLFFVGNPAIMHDASILH